MRVVVGEFEWDDAKAQHNARKHGVTFIEAMECFADPHGVDLADPEHGGRLILIAVSHATRICTVVYAETLGGARLRIISARRATRHEKKFYKDAR